jgi:hypothetical protein
MRLGRLPTGLIALVAAYAVALQALLSAFAVPAGAAFHSAVLCSAESTDRPDGLPRHEPSCAIACAMLNGAAAPPPTAAGPSAPFEGSAAQPIAVASLVVAPQRSPNAARAPPFVV